MFALHACLHIGIDADGQFQGRLKLFSDLSRHYEPQGASQEGPTLGSRSVGHMVSDSKDCGGILIRDQLFA